ncbi:MAG: hypothetical protein Q4C34_09335, partial [Bacteroidales bacterium]|nr:hypothetical protein [Bacteroidales bacterium]
FERGCDLTVKYPANYADVHEQTMLRQIMRGEGHLVRAIAYRAATCDLCIYGSAIAPAVVDTPAEPAVAPIHHKTHRRRITRRVESYHTKKSRHTPPPVAVRSPPQPP